MENIRIYHESLKHDRSHRDHHQPQIAAQDEKTDSLKSSFKHFEFLSFSDHIDARHHAVIFMFQIVAMQQIPAAITAPAHNDVDGFIAINGDSVFPSTLFGARRLAIPSQYLKRHEVYEPDAASRGQESHG